MHGPGRQYELLERIGKGGMGEVFLAEARGEYGFRKTVAIKRVLPELATPEFVEHFVVEAKLSVALCHANVVQVFDLGRAGSDLILVMEHVHGADLGRLYAALERGGEKPPIGAVLHIAIEALKGLAYAHDRVAASGRPEGVVHCDLSPSNLLISYAGEVKIADFGVAQVVVDTQRRNAGGRVVGTLRYIAPELLVGGPFDGRADLYSLAVVLSELLTVHRYFEAPTRDAIKDAILKGMAPHPLALRDDTPPELAELLARAMHVDRARRPESAQSMLAQVMQVAHDFKPVVTAPEVGAWVRRVVPPSAGAVPAPRLEGALRRVLRSARPAHPRTRTLTVAHGDAPPGGALTGSVFVTQKDQDGLTRFEPLVTASSSKRPAALGLTAVALLGIGAYLAKAEFATTPAPASDASSSGVAVETATAAPSAEAPPVPSSEETALAAITATEPAVAASSEPESSSRPSTARNPQRAAPEPPGFLNANAQPWATVFVDGRRFGPTPLVGVSLPPGTHRLHFERPSARPVDRTVRVTSAKTAVVVVDMVPVQGKGQ